MLKHTSPARRVLLTGAAGGIGSAFFRDTADQYSFRLADRLTDTLSEAATQGHELFNLDVADLERCQQACQGIDTVVHLAADASPNADFYGSLLPNNILGVYNIFRAAKDQGCRRVIFASSGQVVIGYPPDVQLQPESPVRPMNMYGVSKSFGEAVAAYFAYAEGLSSIAIRIGAYDTSRANSYWLRQAPNVRNLSAYVSERDMNHLLVRCIETPDIPFAIVHGISNNRFKRLDLSSTQSLLNYQPQDDAFEIFRADLDRWLQDE